MVGKKSLATSGRHLSTFEKRQCGIKPNAVSKASSNFRVKNIGNVLEKSGVAFHLAPPYGGLLV